MLTDDQRARLNPEQLLIAENWELERERTGKIFEKLQRAMETHDDALWSEALQDNADHIPPSMCEHERSIWTHCGECEEIERLLNPEFYNEDGERLDDETIEKLINERLSRD